MQLSTASASSSKRRKPNPSGSRLRKKHKRLDAICEKEYARNHGDSNEGNGSGGDTELRRSSRVRRAPVLLDVSPPRVKKRHKIDKNAKSFSPRVIKNENENENENLGDLESVGGWKSRLRTRGRNVGFGEKEERGSTSGKRNHFKGMGGNGDEGMVAEMELDEKKGELEGELEGGNLTVVKSKRSGRIKASSGSGDKEKEVELSVIKDDNEKEERGSPSGKKKHFEGMGGNRDEGKVVARELDEKKAELEGGNSPVVKSKRSGRIKASNGSGDKEKVVALSVIKDDNEKEERGLPSGKRKHFEGMGGNRDEGKVAERELNEKKWELEGGNSPVVKSKRSGRIKASNGSGDKEKKVESSVIKDDNEKHGEDVVGDKGEKDMPFLESGVSGGNEKEIVDGNVTQVLEYEQREISDGLLLEECVGDENMEKVDQSDKQVEQLELAKEGVNQMDVVDLVGIPTNQEEDGGCCGREDVSFVNLDEKPLEDETAVKVDEEKCASADTLGKQPFKEGRRCGLCGGGTDGKPPKKLVHDAGESENEAYSGSSASEEPNYDIWDGFGDEPGWLGRLLGPINDRYGIAGIWVHQHCAVWSPEVYFAGLGRLKNVRAALCRGRALKCSRCGRPGATIGCRVDRCPKTYHLPCARANGCVFDHRKFLIACTDHRHLFQPHGNKYLWRIKKMKAKKMKLETRKLANDAWRKDIDAEEKWLENCGEDEEFLKRESRRLHRDLLRIAPVYIGGPNSESKKLFQGWESVAGLQDVIRCMKEVVILPLLYPEFFDNLGLTPPRGVLLHGYPGTGKTLVVRALIGSCARGDRRIAYFARKGADCLGKYVGDAERQLRLLFQVAERCQPSIIFFDEIDGLAPCRTRQQDQTHSSVVSTLLALMDGLKSRGSVVVIGATNRPEAVDPALRRPGRFDREIYFPLPSVEDRAAILSLHTQRWPKPVAGTLLKWISRITAGFAGADLQALCTQAAIIALKRNFPLQEILSAAEKKAHGDKRVPLPAFAVEESDWLEALSCAPPPCSRREAGIAANDVVSSPLPMHLIPCLLQPLSTLLVSLYLDERLWLPPALSKAVRVFKSVIVSALDKKKMPSDRWWSHVNNFLQESDVAKEIERKLSYAGMLIGGGSFSGSEAFNDDTDDDNVRLEPFMVNNGGTHTSLLRNISFALRKKSGFRILIAGSPKCGQRHLASCFLHCFVGNVEIQKVDSATILQEGHGDVVQGVARILMKCASVGPCIVFMPRIDLWAVEKRHQVPEESDSASTDDQYVEKKGSCFTHAEIVDKENDSCQQQCESAEMAEHQGAFLSSSDAWSSFIEQVDSLCVSTSLMILATSEVPYPLLPDRIRQFFKGDILDCSQSTALEHTIPQFSVQVDGNFNHDRMINLSAAELSRDIIQQVVQLIHQKTHSHKSSWKEYKTCDSIEVDPDTERQHTDHRSANEREGGKHCPADPIERAPPLANNRIVKGKSSLMLAISTFGYQILRYPHFAELCWVTSKLKEGPCADINGPWKGWPFNSCIVRPNKSLEEGPVACSSSNIKSKEKSGLVRGLLAVGLSAYRGVYTSLREVSLGVRKVLELLVGQIDAKIQAGKDRYQYVRVLSQVAYLEDAVNSWAYALQSLEHPQMIVGNPKLTTVGSPDNNHTCEDDPIQREEDKANVSNSHESEMLEERPKGFAAENINCVDLNKQNGDFSYPSSEGRVAVSEGSLQEMAPLSHSIPVGNPDCCAAADQVTGKTSNEHNGTIFEPCESENIRNHGGVNCDSGALRESNGYVLTESVVLSKDGLYSSGEPSGVKFSCSTEACDQINGLSMMETGIISDDGNPEEHIVDINFSSGKTTTLPTDSGVACLYRCCSECLYTINSLMRKILIREWGLKTNSWTVDDVHDVVASLSVDLLSAVRNVYLAKNFSNSCNEKLRYENRGKLFEHADLMTCNCKISEYSLAMPLECSCHTVSRLETAEANTSPNTQFRSDSKFTFRDGVLVPSDPDKNVSFHCKFETLCLCSLIKSIVMTKCPFD